MRILSCVGVIIQLSITLVSGELDLCPKQDGADATLVALLPLHRGVSCNQVRLKSLQQMAAAQLAIRDANNADNGGEGVTIGLQVMDTCSSEKRAVKMAFKALVLTDTTICKKAPLFLGFLGPDEADILSAVQKVTSVFHLTHVAPLSLTSYPSDSPNFYHVTTVNIAEKVRALLKLLKQVQWTALSIIHASDRETLQLVSALTTATAAPCVSVTRPLPSDAPGLLAEIPTVGVVILGSAEQLEDLLPYLSSSTESHSFILVSSEAGILPSLSLTHTLSSSLIIMQENTQPISGLKDQLTKSPLWDEYLHQQRCNHSSCNNINPDTDEFGLVQGASVVPMSQAVRLYARAFKIAHKLKCAERYGRCSALNNLSPDEWRSILGSASDRGIRFQMEQRTSYQLFYKPQFAHEIQKIGNITEGGRQIALLNNLKFPPSHNALCNGDESDTYPITTPTPPTPPPPKEHDIILIHRDLDTKFTTTHDNKHEEDNDEATRTFFGGGNFDFFDMNSYTTIETVAVFAGLASGIGLIITLLIYIVYSNFKVKGSPADNRSRGGSSRRSSVRSV